MSDDVFASVFIFGIPDRELFPGKFRSVAELVQKRAHHLLEQASESRTGNDRRARSLEKIASQDIDELRTKTWRKEE